MPSRRPPSQESFFNWFYLAINIGSLLACTIIVYIQDSISWTIGFAIPGKCATSLSSHLQSQYWKSQCVVIYTRLVHKSHRGSKLLSPLSNIAIVAAILKCHFNIVC